MDSQYYLKAHRLGKLENLLQETLEAYYWCGFIAADGTFNHSTMRFKIALSNKDLEHLKKLAEFLNYSGTIKDTKNNTSGFAIQDKVNVYKIIHKFDFKQNKTMNPPSLIIDEEEKFLAFIIGFIDGDGCINKQTGREDCILRIKIHSSWLNWLTLVIQRLSSIIDVKLTGPKINNQGYTSLQCGNRILLDFLKKKSYALPVLQRKWSKIDENRVKKK